MSYGKRSQNFYGGRGSKVLTAVAVAAPVFQINQGQYQGVVKGALRLAFVNEKYPVKKIAQIADTSEATAKNWWEGRSTPIGLHLLRLIATVPELQSEVRRLTAMESALDPSFERELHGLFDTFQKIRKGK